MNYLASYPRSGNTWVRFILEWFSGQPTKGITNNEISISQSRISNPKQNKLIRNELKHVKGKPLIQKVHWSNQINKKKGKLILIIRNPLEVILRHTKKLDNKDIDRYMSLIKIYEEWDNKNKIILYYEDLINEPKTEIKKIIKFMELDLNKLETFMESYDYFFNLSVNHYNNKGDGDTSKTKGKILVYHSLGLQKKKITNFKNYVVKKYPNLITHLSKYDLI